MYGNIQQNVQFFAVCHSFFCLKLFLCDVAMVMAPVKHNRCLEMFLKFVAVLHISQSLQIL